MRLALYQPDIPQNTGTLLRLSACLGIGADIIEPCGFPFSEQSLRRFALDYWAAADISRHISWDAFMDHPDRKDGRLVLLTTKAAHSYVDTRYEAGDTLLLGRESAGVPDVVHETADLRIKIPMASGLRSLNVAVAAAMVLGEALRQTAGFPTPDRNRSEHGEPDANSTPV